jgi:hypothetical protein
VRALNGSMLEIIPSIGDRGSNQMKDPGIRHLAIDVSDFDAAHRQLGQSGVKFWASRSRLKVTVWSSSAIWMGTFSI